jgi:predicted transcriptional regulators
MKLPIKPKKNVRKNLTAFLPSIKHFLLLFDIYSIILKKSSIFVAFAIKILLWNTRTSLKIKELRLEKGLGQTELAKMLGVSKGVISLLENGLREPGMYSPIPLSKFFNVTIDELAGID